MAPSHSIEVSLADASRAAANTVFLQFCHDAVIAESELERHGPCSRIIQTLLILAHQLLSENAAKNHLATSYLESSAAAGITHIATYSDRQRKPTCVLH